MTRKEAARAYRKLSRELMRLHGAAAPHISRRDNNRVFDAGVFLRDVASRIKSKYADECPECHGWREKEEG